MIQALFVALSTFSRLPCPKTDWTDETAARSLCFFPLIGAVLGGLVWIWLWLCGVLQLQAGVCAGGILTLIIFLTGGIHLDGFCDTVDARASYQPKERKLDILQDPHVGAFALMKLGLYLLVYFACLMQVSAGVLPIYCFVFVLSRVLGTVALLRFPLAKQSGMLYYFQSTAKPRLVLGSMAGYLLLLLGLGIWQAPLYALVLGMTALGVLVYVHRMACRTFGGMTGDILGYFIQLCELFCLVVLMFVERMCLLWC